MKLSKKMISAYVLAFLALGMAVRASAAGEVSFPPKTEPAMAEAQEKEETQPIIFWYVGAENRAFFEACADDFRKETGIAVILKEQPSLNYFSEIYEASKSGQEAPDVYLLEADGLKQAYFAQLLEKNEKAEEYKTGWAENAVLASSCEQEMYGYPLYFHTSMFAFRTDYFEEMPATVQKIIEYSTEHEPEEGVEKLLEWDLSEGFYNFPFFGCAVQWKEEEDGTMQWSYDEEKYQECSSFFGNLTAAIELDENAVSSESVAGDFKDKKTVAVFLDSDDMEKVAGDHVKIACLPDLNEELPMVPAAKTEVLCVNGLSEKKPAASAFAWYVSSQKPDQLAEMTGHVPVKEDALATEEQKLAYQQYEASRIEPDAMNATDFWIKFQNEVLNIWNAE